MHASHTLATVLNVLWWLVLALLTLAYLYAVAKRRAGLRRWSGGRTAGWLIGVSLIGLATAPPVAAAAHHDLRLHMVQHLLIGMVAPLGLVFAAPLTLAFGAVSVPAARRITRLVRSRPVRWLSHPFSALSLNIGGMYLLYLTPLYAASMRNPYLHQVIAIHFLAAGVLFTWAIVGPDPAPHRARWGVRLAALFSSIAAHALLAKGMYAYGWPQGVGSDAGQIAAAAQLMYYGGDLAELALAIWFFAIWYGQRHAGDKTAACR